MLPSDILPEAVDWSRWMMTAMHCWVMFEVLDRHDWHGPEFRCKDSMGSLSFDGGGISIDGFLGSKLAVLFKHGTGRDWAHVGVDLEG